MGTVEDGAHAERIPAAETPTRAPEGGRSLADY
jgi:hypothetical protein